LFSIDVLESPLLFDGSSAFSLSSSTLQFRRPLIAPCPPARFSPSTGFLDLNFTLLTGIRRLADDGDAIEAFERHREGIVGG